MLVNGNLGAGVAVAGAFSLVRFRSAPGSAKDIGAVFLAMAIGLATDMGYLMFAALLLAVYGAASLAMVRLNFGRSGAGKKQLKITIPENMDYNELFDDVFAKYTLSSALTVVKTANMGSLYRLTYEIELKDARREKEMIDELRCRNGNLEISCGRISGVHEEL